MGLTACQNEYDDEQIVANDSVVVTFVADAADDTRTSVDTSDKSKPVFAWGDNETFAVLEQTDALAEATSVTFTNEDGKAKIEAEFDTNAGKGSYNYVTIYPESGYIEAESIEAVTLSLPAAQTMAEGSYDPAADLMVSEVVTTTAQPTEAQSVRFTRLAAVAKMTLKNFSLEAGDEVESVTFTAEDKVLAGTFTTDLANPAEFTVAEGVNNVTVATTSTGDVYFTVLPTTIAVSDSFTVTIVTNRHVYVKQVTIPEGKKPLTFEAGNVTLFSVNMADAQATVKWTHVKSVDDLNSGDVVLIAAQNYDYVMGKWGSSYPNGSKTTITKEGDYLYHPVELTSGDDYLISRLIVSRPDENVAKVHFYNDYKYDTYKGFVCSPTSNNYLKVQDYPDNNSLFTISITDGVTTIENENSTYGKLQFYQSGSSTRFRCQKTASEGMEVCIYKLEGLEGIIPVSDAVFTVPTTQKIISKEAVNENVALEEVEFKYVGNWAITTSATVKDSNPEVEADWLTLNYADGKLSYTAEANENIGPRYAVVTITASHDGKESISKSFIIAQKGEPKEISVAEFITKPTDKATDFRVTGILTYKPTSVSSGTTIADVDDTSKEATFKYIYMTDGTSKFVDNKDVKVGDLVTIVAPVTSSKTGGSDDMHAICEGYYNVSATADADLVEYTGGKVNITIAKSGTLQPGTINGSVSANFAELEYTPGADKATLTLPANEDAPRQVVVTFTYGYATTSVTVVQGADTSKGNTWELVTDASTLEEGDKVIIAAQDYDVALGTTMSSKNSREGVNITKLENYYLTPAMGTQTFILGKGTVAGTFAFYDENNRSFLVSSSSSDTAFYLESQAYCDENTSFAIGINDGVTTIGNKEGDFATNKLYYHQSNNIFYSGTAEKQGVCLYRLVGVKGTIPVVPADIEVPTEAIVVAQDGDSSVAIDEVVVNYVGEWSISVDDDADWLTVSYADGKFTYTAEENNSAVRTANVTITAECAGQTAMTWDFTLRQIGVATQMSIADFLAIAEEDRDDNADVRYSLTGRIVEIKATSDTGSRFTITDGEYQIDVLGIVTEVGNKYFFDLNLQVGDVVTVTSPRFTTIDTAGKSNTPAYYKGHYRLAAETTAASYEGGNATVNISVDEYGSAEAPASLAITSSEVVLDDVVTAYSFVDNNNKTATATVTFAANDGKARTTDITYEYGLTSLVVSVAQEKNPTSSGWFLVKDVNELAVGDKVIIVGISPDGTKSYAISSTASNSTFRPVKEITIVDGAVNDVEGVQQYTLESGYTGYEGTWAFKGDSDNKYLYVSSGLKVTSTLNKSGSWNVDIDEDGKATLKANSSTSATASNIIMLNYTASNQTFSVYKSTQTGKGAIYIYKFY